MSSISDDGTTAPPPGLSKDQRDAVRTAREVIAEGYEANADTPLYDVLANLLSAYEALAARTAWLAAEYASLMEPDRYDGLS